MSVSGTFRPPPLTLLTDDHDVAQFDSGERALDAWLRDHARTTARRGLSATHVWVGPDMRVLGYATLAASTLNRSDLPKSVGHGFPETIPSVLLARLALHTELRGQKLGSVLLVDALGIAARSAADVAAAFVVVDALNDRATAFYRDNGFRLLPGTSRLVLKMSAAVAAGRA
jgi:ribosomal protein S18 acetylase RimI-like enzyme